MTKLDKLRQLQTDSFKQDMAMENSCFELAQGFEHGFNACAEILLTEIEALRSALDRVDCSCSVADRFSGHMSDCWKPELDEALARINERFPK